jgi:hypothetical protein
LVCNCKWPRQDRRSSRSSSNLATITVLQHVQVRVSQQWRPHEGRRPPQKHNNSGFWSHHGHHPISRIHPMSWLYITHPG